MRAVRVGLAVGNYAVSLLNAIAAMRTREPRDWLAAIVWAGSGTVWLWQAVVL